METIHTNKNSEGVYSCELPVTVDEWQEILSNPKVTTDNYKRALLAFYDEPEHKSTCKKLGIKHYGNAADGAKYNIWITKFGEAVVKHLNRFHVIDSDGKERFWHISMCQGTDNDEGLFETTLRPEIVKAIENLKLNLHFTWIPFYSELAEKLMEYMDNRSDLVNLIYGLDNQYVDYITAENGGHVDDIDPFSVFAIFNRGINNTNRLKILSYFKDKLNLHSEMPTDFDGIPVVNNMSATFYWRQNISTDIQPIWDLYKSVISDDLTDFTDKFNKVRKQQGVRWNITTGLFWIRPYEYISLDSRNMKYLPSLNVNVFKEKDFDAEHYLSLLNEVKVKIVNNDILENNIPEISYNAWLNETDDDIVKVWFVRDPNDDQFSYCLSEKSLFFNCENKIGDMSPMGDDIKAFSKSLGEAAKVKKSTVLYTYWQLSHEVKEKDIIVYFKTKDEVLAWGYVVKEYTYNDTNKFHHSIGVEWNKVDGVNDSPIKHSAGLWFKDIRYNDAKPLLDMLNINVEDSENSDMKYEKYIDILKESKNLVLTGAPGTGKTFMAKEIAKEMGAVTKFVQFHPSYDYTDFVEGLRPIEKGEDKVGFRRMDGTFKSFCKSAIINVATENDDILNKLNNDPNVWKVSLGGTYDNPTRTDCLANGYIRIGWSDYGDVDDFNDKQDFPKGGKAILRAFQSEMQVGDIVVSCYSQYETDAIGIITGDYEYRQEGGNFPRYRTVEWLIKDQTINILDVIGKRMTLSTIYKLNVSVTDILNIVKNNGGLQHQYSDFEKPYVMIIDEINRGEVSKIFGELFFAIDPGYRGVKGIVNTQYQNMIEKGDVFYGGFYVPENVYILATMNDIDRSVESMDFAMRRRFTWKEITPADTESMLDVLDCANEAKSRMQRLNDVISQTDGLGTAYMVGPSYFLKLKDNGGNFDKLWEMNIEPLLREYVRGFRKIEEIMNKFKSAYYNTEVPEE